MTDTITVEFSRKELKANCKLNCPISIYKNCERTDYNLLRCLLNTVVWHKIKEQKNDKQKEL